MQAKIKSGKEKLKIQTQKSDLFEAKLQAASKEFELEV